MMTIILLGSFDCDLYDVPFQVLTTNRQVTV